GERLTGIPGEIKLHLLHGLMAAGEAGPPASGDERHPLILGLARDFRAWFSARVERELEDVEQGLQEPDWLRRILCIADLGLTMLIGILEDGVLTRGLPAIDDVEFRDWLRSHGARETTVDSSPVRALYDCAFAYEEGDLSRPNFAAGVAVGVILRI